MHARSHPPEHICERLPWPALDRHTDIVYTTVMAITKQQMLQHQTGKVFSVQIPLSQQNVG